MEFSYQTIAFMFTIYGIYFAISLTKGGQSLENKTIHYCDIVFTTKYELNPF